MAVYLDKYNMKMESKTETLYLHMLIRSFHNKWNLTKADILTLIELWENGYGLNFYSACVNKGFFKNKQSVRNSINKMEKLNLIQSEKRGLKKVNPTTFPLIEQEKVLIQYTIGNL